MNKLNVQQTLTLSLPLFLSLSLCVLSSCKPETEKKPPSTDDALQFQVSQIQKQAEKVINEDPHVELLEVHGDKLHIQNKYTKRAVILPFQQIIDGHYELIQEDQALAERINQIKKDQIKTSPISQVSPKLEGWGNAPSWIPKYPGLKVSPSQIHTPRKDGSIWGYITGSHPDPIENIEKFLVSGFKKSGLTLTRNLVGKQNVTMLFSNTQALTDDQQEKRKVHCSLTKQGNKTLLTIQYSYGM